MSPAAAVAVVLVLMAGGASVGAVGFGAVLVSAPVVAAVEPGLVPFVFFIPSVSTNAALAIASRADIDVPFLRRATISAIPGAALGTALLSRVQGGPALTLLVAGIVLVVVLVQVSPWRPERTPTVVSISGGLSGASGSISGMAGPPLAVVIAHSPPRVIRATLPAVFASIQFLSLIGWAVGGVLDLEALAWGVAAVPPMMLGGVLGRRWSKRLSEALIRRSVVALALGSIVSAVVRALT